MFPAGVGQRSTRPKLESAWLGASNLLMTTTRLKRWTLAIGVGLILTACDSKQGTDPTNEVDKAAAIAKEIKASPDEAEAILKKHEVTEAEFEALMFEIAEDPQMSESFVAKVGG